MSMSMSDRIAAYNGPTKLSVPLIYLHGGKGANGFYATALKSYMNTTKERVADLVGTLLFIDENNPEGSYLRMAEVIQKPAEYLGEEVSLSLTHKGHLKSERITLLGDPLREHPCADCSIQ